MLFIFYFSWFLMFYLNSVYNRIMHKQLFNTTRFRFSQKSRFFTLCRASIYIIIPYFHKIIRSNQLRYHYYIILTPPSHFLPKFVVIKHILHSNILVHQYQNIYSVSSIVAFLCILSVPFISDKSTSDFKVRIVSASWSSNLI